MLISKGQHVNRAVRSMYAVKVQLQMNLLQKFLAEGET
jgi:hypothetical protein